MKQTIYTIPAPMGQKPLTLAIAADLHNRPHHAVIAALQSAHPDVILIPGDLMDDVHLENPDSSGYEFLRACAAMAPTFYSLGNHELACYHKGNPWRHPIPRPLSQAVKQRIAQSGAILLDNEECEWNGLRICGLTSGINGKENKPSAEALARFAAGTGTRVLLCHHPEYFIPFIQKTDIALTVCGHAHGGHWRFFGRGIYSPGQGLFPKYTSGVIENRCIISRGLGNHTIIPRICNPTELVLVRWGTST